MPPTPHPTHTVPSVLPYLEDPVDSSSSSVTFSCPQCRLDLCSSCFHGHFHPFHTHRLCRAKPELVYRSTEGSWRCDGCTSLHPPQAINHHCSQCEVDLCVDCFSGSLKHPLHTQHSLTPVDPTILYRMNLSWTCDNCNNTFNSTNKTIFYHCHLCQWDLCKTCFHGNKHPLHAHPLHKCDPRFVYPQSEGLWYCDNCTHNHRRGQQRALPPHAIMYHCAQCEYDLCEPCYKAKPMSTLSTHQSRVYEPPTQPNRQPKPYEPPTQPNRQPKPYEPPTQPNRQPTAYNQATPQPPISYELGSQGPLFPSTTAMLCLVCSRRPATHTFSHGGHRCSMVGLVCEGCGEDVLLDKRLCPYCRELPDSAERLH